MSSILTNTSAMVALQTLSGINSNLAKAQDEISTGKTVGSAKDNAAVWSISKIMESDVAGLSTISDSLELGSSTVAVASEGAETITDLLTQMKEKIVSAQDESVDRAKIQTDIDALRDQISSVVSAAQFNGLNLLQGSDAMTVLASLDRKEDGSVNPNYITVNRQDLTATQGSLGTGTGTTDLSSNIVSTSTTLSSAAVRDDGASTPVAANIALTGDFSTRSISFNIAGTTLNFGVGELSATNTDAAQSIADKINAAQIDGITVVNNAGTLEFSSTKNFDTATISTTLGGTGGTLSAASVTLDQRAESFTFSNSTVKDGDGYQFALSNGITATYVATAGDSMEDVVKGLKAAIDSNNNADIATNVTQNSSGQWVLEIANEGTASVTTTITANTDANGNAVRSGGLAGLSGIDVTTDAGAAAALANIETYIQTATEAAAALGSSATRIETQNTFVSNLIDSMNTGIGSLVDADMEEASARLQALQTQQQLGIQALSIANQQPQTILSLFQ